MGPSQIKKSDVFRITGNWDVQSRKLKEKYAQLSDTDLKFETGKDNELLDRGRTQIKDGQRRGYCCYQKNPNYKSLIHRGC